MKTSNKILIGLLITVFTVPFLLAYSLKNKMKKGEYTVEKFDKLKNSSLYTGSFTAFKAVKVVGPGPQFLKCSLVRSNEMSYEYYSDSKDRIEVTNANDTLIIRYKPATPDGFDDLTINVNVPTLSSLVVDGAAVTLDSIAMDEGITITLKNKGVVKDGTKKAKIAKVQAADNSNPEVISQSSKLAKAEVDEAPIQSLRMAASHLDLNIKDLLIFRLLYRI